MRALVYILAAAGILTGALLAGGLVTGPDSAGAPEIAAVASESDSKVVGVDTGSTVAAATLGVTVTSTTAETGLADIEDGATGSATVTFDSVDEVQLDGRWGVNRINTIAAWQAANSFVPVLVAVLDTGIDSDAGFGDRVEAVMDFTGSGNTDDEHGHGTHMAGTIAAIAPNASFINLKVADERGRCDSSTVARAIRWAADRGAQVINVSLEVESSPELESAIRHAWQKGAVVIAAAGNHGTTAPAYPAAYTDAIAVAGTNEKDGLAVLSNHGDWVDVAAPGSKIYAELPGGEYGYETGTSPAAAHVSGIAALLCGIAADESGNGFVNDEVRAAIEDSCEPLAVSGTGNGLVNALSAMQVLAA